METFMDAAPSVVSPDTSPFGAGGFEAAPAVGGFDDGTVGVEGGDTDFGVTNMGFAPADTGDAAPPADFGEAPAIEADFGEAPAIEADFGEPVMTGAAVEHDFGDAPAVDAGFGADGFEQQGDMNGMSTEVDAGGAVDYYTSDAVLSMPDVPVPGHFEADGSYVPPSDLKEEETMVDTTVLDAWEVEHKEAMLQRDSEERASVNDQQDTARQELEQFEEERRKRVAQTKENNIAEQTLFEQQRDTPVDAKNLWDRVTQLVDVGKTNDNPEIARFSSLLLQLKHNPI